MSIPATFPLFANLPVELRLKIWTSALPGPRNVGIEIRFNGGRFGGWMARKSTPPPPVALHICVESRLEALKRYILSFGTIEHPPTVYFNYQSDTLCFGDGTDTSGLVSRHTRQTTASDYLLNLWHGKTYNPTYNNSKVIQAKNVRYVTLDVDESIYSRPSFCWEEVRRFEGLEELLIVTWDPEDRAEELMAYFKTALDAVADANPEWLVPKTEVVSALGRRWGSLQLGEDVSV